MLFWIDLLKKKEVWSLRCVLKSLILKNLRQMATGFMLIAMIFVKMISTFQLCDVAVDKSLYITAYEYT